jgi:hypothetical protein
LRDLLTEDTVTRKKRGYTRDPDTGRATTSIIDVESFDGSIQPASGRDVELLDEGERTGDEIKVYIRGSHDLNVANEDTKKPGDLVEFNGDDYEVVHTRTYDATIPHTKAIARKVQ